MAHGHLQHDSVSRGTRRALVWIVAALAAATALGMIVMWPGEIDKREARPLGLVSEVFAADVIAARIRPCTGTTRADDVLCRHVKARLLAGPDEGKVREFDLSVGDPSPRLKAGDEIVVSYERSADGPTSTHTPTGNGGHRWCCSF